MGNTYIHRLQVIIKICIKICVKLGLVIVIDGQRHMTTFYLIVPSHLESLGLGDNVGINFDKF